MDWKVVDINEKLRLATGPLGHHFAVPFAVNLEQRLLGVGSKYFR